MSTSLVIAMPGEVPRKYPIPEGFTYRELQIIKVNTGLRPGDFEDALEAGDPDMQIMLAYICARRAGHKISIDQLMELEVGAISVEAEDDDPTSAAEDANEAATLTTREDGGTPDSHASTASDPGKS